MGRETEWEGLSEASEVDALRAENERLTKQLVAREDEVRGLSARIDAALAAYGRHGKWPDNPRWFEAAEAMVRALKGKP